MKKYIKASKTWDMKFRHQLASDLVHFMQDYDWYEYADTLEVGETEEDAIGEMETELYLYPEDIMAVVYKIGQNDPSVSAICDDLVDRINEILPE